jgi:hypothetical protein
VKQENQVLSSNAFAVTLILALVRPTGDAARHLQRGGSGTIKYTHVTDRGGDHRDADPKAGGQAQLASFDVPNGQSVAVTV